MICIVACMCLNDYSYNMYVNKNKKSDKCKGQVDIALMILMQSYLKRTIVNVEEK